MLRLGVSITLSLSLSLRMLRNLFEAEPSAKQLRHECRVQARHRRFCLRGGGRWWSGGGGGGIAG